MRVALVVAMGLAVVTFAVIFAASLMELGK